MSDTMDPMATEVDQQESAQQLLAQAREQGIEPMGPGGLLNRLTKNVLETALEAEMDERLGYGKHDVGERGSGNSRNGTRTKTVLTAAEERFVEFSGKWGRQYPAITRLWENAWSESVPFLDYAVEIRCVICSANAIESVNARYRRAVRARGHFPPGRRP
jgi:transposase-like protein